MKGRSWVVSSKLKSNFQCRREWVVGLASEDPGHKGFLLEACRGRGRKRDPKGGSPLDPKLLGACLKLRREDGGISGCYKECLSKHGCKMSSKDNMLMINRDICYP